jgi:hypothetical protein
MMADWDNGVLGGFLYMNDINYINTNKFIKSNSVYSFEKSIRSKVNGREAGKEKKRIITIAKIINLIILLR